MEKKYLKNLVVEMTAALAGENPTRFEEIAVGLGLAEWIELTGIMVDEGVAFLIFYFIEKRNLGGLLPKEALDALAGLYYSNLKKNIFAAAALKKVLQRLNADRIPCIALKGLVLAERFYPGFATRGMSDADVLVYRKDVRRVDESLSALGYSAVDSRVDDALQNPPGYLTSLDYRKKDGAMPNIHIHWHTVNTSVPAYMFSEKIDMKRLWEKAIPAHLAGTETRILCPEHHVIYLCEHGLRINHSFDRLILIYDIFYAIGSTRYSVDWDYVIGEARRFGLERLVFLSLSVARRFAPPCIPDAVVQDLRPPALAGGEKIFLRMQLGNRRFRGAAMLVYLAMNKGIRGKIVFLYRTFFPPRHILLQRGYAPQEKFSAVWYWRRTREALLHLCAVLRAH